MITHVSIQIRKPVYEKLRRLAVLTGDESSAIERLIAIWESSAASPSHPSTASAKVEFWHSPTGDVIRVGEKLQASDAGATHEAIVERDGIRFKGTLYDSPSAAARAVKHLRGLRGPSASTNGRDFWRLRDPETNRWVPIRVLRQRTAVDTDALLARLKAM